MAAKDKEVKALDKLKQFFRFNRGLTGVKTKEDIILSPELEKELSAETPLNQRIKLIRELTETVATDRLEDNAPAKLWKLLEDLLDPSVSKENRHVILAFFRAMIQGQYDKLGLMRAKLFDFIRHHKVKEDTRPRLDLLQSLTDNGRDVLHFEEKIGAFLLEWMPVLQECSSSRSYSQDHSNQQYFLNILVNIIKYNAACFEEETIAGLVQSTCHLCCQSAYEEVVHSCIQVLDTVVCYANLPPESLPLFVATLCRTVNIEMYCPNSWKVMRNLLGTHLGHSSLYTMCRLLKYDSCLSDAGLLRGAVFYINMALWGNKRIPSLKCTPGSVLPAFAAAVRCKHSVVMYEVVLGIQRLVANHGHELLDPTWESLLNIIALILNHIEESGANSSLNQVSVHLHETLTKIEQLIELGQFNGHTNTVFTLIEKCSQSRPETSVLRLISYCSSSIEPTTTDWLEKLDGLLLRFYGEEKRPNVRIKVLGILANVIQNNRYIYEEELVHLVLVHLKDTDKEPDIAVRSAAAQLLVDLALNSQPKSSLKIMDILEKILDPGFESVSSDKSKVEEEASDIKMTAHGLVKAFTVGIYSSDPSPAIRAFALIAKHLKTHYERPNSLRHVTSIREMMLECLLRLRADSLGRVGIVGVEPIRFSVYLVIPKPITQPGELPVDIMEQSMPQIATLPLTLAIEGIVKALIHELDWKILLLILKELPSLLKNRSLFVAKQDIEMIGIHLCALVSDKTLCLPERLVNTPPKFTSSDLHNYVFPVLVSLVSYHTLLEPTLQRRLIKCFEFGLASRSARQCVSALTTCTLEMRDAMVKLLPEVLLNLSKISATVVIALPILEFLSTLTQLPKVFANFVGDQYMSVFAISLPYTNPFKYTHYIVSLAHHVIAAWFLKCRLPFRRDFVKFITTGLKSNIFVPFEDCQVTKSELVNEDSSNRKRSSSLTEQGSRKKTAPPKPNMDAGQMSFHKELNETCIDLMAMYTFSNCSPLPKRHPTAEMLLNEGQSMTWLLGNKLITITTSGCALKPLKHGLCDRCYQICRVQPVQKQNSTPTPNKDGNRSFTFPEGGGSISGNSGSTASEDESSIQDPSTPKLPLISSGGDKGEGRQMCACWCQNWAEIFIRRPTGAMSWMMRLQNEPQCPYLQDLPRNDISTLFLPALNKGDNLPPNDDELLGPELRISSDPVSIPGSPIKRVSGYGDQDFDDFYEGTGRNRNPVRRSNSSPEMSASWKMTGHNLNTSGQGPSVNRTDGGNAADGNSDTPVGEPGEAKKKQKEHRVNCESIPEEMGTTPPTCEALMLAPMDQVGTRANHLPTSTLSRLQQESDVSRGPDGLPPLRYRDRGHTISVMSPARKSTREWDVRTPRSSPRTKETTLHKSGVNPGFVFLQLYHSAHLGSTHEKPLLISNAQHVLKTLDWIPPYEVHKIGVLYVGPGQCSSEVEILKNQYGSIRYAEFLQRLGTLINLEEADRQQVYLGGLSTDGNDGKFAYIWQDDVMQVIFHVATLMPNAANDPQGTRKKTHIGNNYVSIVYNDSGEEYNFQTVKAQFNTAVVVIEPLDQGSNQVSVKTRDDIAKDVQHSCQMESKVVSDRSVAILARQLAVHMNLAAMMYGSPRSSPRSELYASNWLERLRWIRRLHNKLAAEGSGADSSSHPNRTPSSYHPSRRHHMDDFTEYT